MKLGVYTVYDKLTKEFQNPFNMPNDSVFLREIVNVLKDDKDNEIKKNQKDKVAYRIAWFDTESGEYENAKKALLDLNDVKIKK